MLVAITWPGSGSLTPSGCAPAAGPRRDAEGLVVHCGRPDRGPLWIRACPGLALAWPFSFGAGAPG